MQKPLYTDRALKNQWINHLVSAHDLVCGCSEALKHTVQEICKKEPEIKKCLTTEEDTPTAGDAVDGLSPGDLDLLFADDTGEDTG